MCSTGARSRPGIAAGRASAARAEALRPPPRPFGRASAFRRPDRHATEGAGTRSGKASLAYEYGAQARGEHKHGMVTRVQEFSKRFKLEVSGAGFGAFFWAIAALSDLLVVDFKDADAGLILYWAFVFVAATLAGGLYGFLLTGLTRYIWYRSKFVALFILLPAALFYVAGALIVVKLRPGGF